MNVLPPSRRRRSLGRRLHLSTELRDYLLLSLVLVCILLAGAIAPPQG